LIGFVAIYIRLSLVDIVNTINSLIFSRIFQIWISHLPRWRSSDAPYSRFWD